MNVEPGIPIPKACGPRCPSRKTAASMAAGDSVLCGSDGEADSLRYALRKMGYKAAKRKMDGGYRIWRTE